MRLQVMNFKTRMNPLAANLLTLSMSAYGQSNPNLARVFVDLGRRMRGSVGRPALDQPFGMVHATSKRFDRIRHALDSGFDIRVRCRFRDETRYSVGGPNSMDRGVCSDARGSGLYAAWCVRPFPVMC